MTRFPLSSVAPVAALLLGLSSLAGCSEDEPNPVPPAGCPAEDKLDGVCVGAPAKVCDSDPCTQDVSCSSTTQVADDAALASALDGAGPGSCIALAPGSYGEVQLPGGVALLGRSAAEVQVAKITMAAGAGSSIVRGLRVGSGGLLVAGATDARVEAVKVSGASAEGVVVSAGSSVDFLSTTIETAARYGLLIEDGAVVGVDKSLVASNEGPGIWSSCADGCTCAAKPVLEISQSIVRDNRIAGVVLYGSQGTLSRVDVLRTKVGGNNWHFGEGGGGISVAACSSITAQAVKVRESKSVGVLVHDSSAQLGGPDTSQGIEIDGNLRGLWLEAISETEPNEVHVENATMADNTAVGLGLGGASKGIIIICKTAITGTQLATLPVFENDMDLGTAKEVGDGLDWLDGSEATMEELTLSGNARASMLIDGPAAGSLSQVTLSGGDEQKGIVQQSYTSGPQPQLGGGVPPISISAQEQFSIAKPPVTFGGVL